MDWVKSEFGDFLAPPKKRQKIDDSFVCKEIVTEHSLPNQTNFIQISRYAPKTKDELVVNKKKIEEVEHWLRNIDYEKAYLLLTGPPGCGKLKTLSILCKSFNIDCIEWCSPTTSFYDPENVSLYKSELSSFEEFILRASRYTNIISSASKRLVVVKDIPNAFLRENAIFHTFMEQFFEIKNVHIVFIVSDNMVCRNLFSEHIKLKYYIKNINFNPITQKSITVALNNVIKKFEISKINSKAESYSNEISIICNGDLRNALTMLHFLLAKGKSCRPLPVPNKKKQRGKTKTTMPSGNITNIISDNKIDIFHGLGRILYAKRENNKLVHDPQEVSESFTSSPNLFIGMLHENYLHTFSNVHDMAEAANSLVVSDLLLQDWNQNSMLLGCGVSVAAHGVMISNSAPIRKFQQFNKSQVKRETLLSETKDILESANPIWKGNDILLDIAPYGSKISYLDFEHKDILKKLSQFS